LHVKLLNIVGGVVDVLTSDVKSRYVFL